MTNTRRERKAGLFLAKLPSVRIPIATKLMLSFVLIIAIVSIAFSVLGARLIGRQIISEAQGRISNGLNSGREIYLSEQGNLYDVVRLTAERFFLKNALMAGNIKDTTNEMIRVRQDESLDVLTITDSQGIVLLRTTNLMSYGDDQSQDELVKMVLERKTPVAGTSIVAANELQKESPQLVSQAYIQFVPTLRARVRNESEDSAGMMLKAAAPVLDQQRNLIGVLYGGILLNKNYKIVDKIKQTVFQDMRYQGEDIGTATIFQGDVRISTNVRDEDGTRAIGTRVSEEVYNQVIGEGRPWIGRAFVVNNWYLTAYEPIRNINNQIIGILYVGIMEQKYLDIQKQTIVVFLTITIVSALISIALSYFISLRISGPIKKLAVASTELSKGNLDTKVAVTTNDELGELAITFNAMALALKERDAKLKEFTRSKIMESERLALIGQLSANVAHELNNPLQGIVTYSYLLLEKTSLDNSARDFLQKIVIQADRCRNIIRGLLDFSRQRKPDKTLCNINQVLEECVALLENQALFHNIRIIDNLAEELPLAIIDPTQIERVFMNLIINAAEAMNGAGQLTLTTRVSSLDGSIEVEFEDTGSGIAKENLEKIFDPFFTTKDTGHGVGLGLAISYGIVKEHKGSITVESELSKGTTFIVSIPVTTKEMS